MYYKIPAAGKSEPLVLILTWEAHWRHWWPFDAVWKHDRLIALISAFEFSAAEPRHAVAKVALGPPNDLSSLGKVCDLHLICGLACTEKLLHNWPQASSTQDMRTTVWQERNFRRAQKGLALGGRPISQAHVSSVRTWVFDGVSAAANWEMRRLSWGAVSSSFHKTEELVRRCTDLSWRKPAGRISGNSPRISKLCLSAWAETSNSKQFGEVVFGHTFC